jgi:hypothetical protein
VLDSRLEGVQTADQGDVVELHSRVVVVDRDEEGSPNR